MRIIPRAEWGAKPWRNQPATVPASARRYFLVHYHGGVIASALDTCGALAAWSHHDFTKGRRASTIAMSVQYVGVAKRSDLLCEAVAVKRGKELIFTEITATDADGRVVAHAVQTYRIA